VNGIGSRPTSKIKGYFCSFLRNQNLQDVKKKFCNEKFDKQVQTSLGISYDLIEL
jgi:hypothetical protein